MKKLLILLMLIGSVAYSDFYFFIIKEHDLSFRRNMKSTLDQGHSLYPGGYQIAVSKAQFDAGYDALDTNFVISVVAGLELELRSNKADVLKEADNLFIKFLRDEGYIASDATVVPENIEQVVREQLVKDGLTNDPQASARMGRFQFVLYAIRAAGGVPENAMWHDNI